MGGPPGKLPKGGSSQDEPGNPKRPESLYINGGSHGLGFRFRVCSASGGFLSGSRLPFFLSSLVKTE